ncbi:hypothetical protein J2Z66_001359 [Paenibacillus eucommiae]|uniref:Transposase n=1 Tax=Paenibacillus eucommiae TaxID=1355755 RepID=A0ABS4IRW6_9BACL|nr:hypothetical protein [Paenibacillus eucommiae]
MDLKELIRLAKSLDNRDKQKLIRFLQSETKGAAAPTRVIDEIQEQEGFSLRKCAELMYEEVSFVTLFYWRIRFSLRLNRFRPKHFKVQSKWIDRFNVVATKYSVHYLAWFRYLDSKEYENTASNKKNMLVSSCLFSVKDTNARLRRMAYC